SEGFGGARAQGRGAAQQRRRGAARRRRRAAGPPARHLRALAGRAAGAGPLVKKKPGRDVIDLNARRRAERPPRISKEQWLKTAVCAAAGVLLFLSCADFDIWPLTWIAVAPLIAVALHPTTKKPAFYGFVT